jgi:hypothetical protein
MRIIEINDLFKEDETAKISKLDQYITKAKEIAGEGNDVTLTGSAPIWLYLKIAHALHGKARRLFYRSPATGDVDLLIFDHNPF